MKSTDLTEAPYNPYNLYNPAKTRSKNVPKMKTSEKIAEFISTHCGDIVSIYKNSNGNYLYRGMRTSEPIVYTNIRPDRKSLEMPATSHAILHKAYLELGLTATRTNSIFCTTNTKVAGEWGGQVAIVFVTNGWSGTVFNKAKKGYSFYSLRQAARVYEWERAHPLISDRAFSNLLSEIKLLQPKAITSPEQLTPILVKKYEDILITGKSYVGLGLYGPNVQETTAEILQLLDLPLPKQLR